MNENENKKELSNGEVEKVSGGGIGKNIKHKIKGLKNKISGRKELDPIHARVFYGGPSFFKDRIPNNLEKPEEKDEVKSETKAQETLSGISNEGEH